MKKLLALSLVFIACGIAILPKPSQAFNPATHIYIAEQAFPTVIPKIDFYYGSIAPDLALYVLDGKWSTAFDDTHYAFIDLSSFAWSRTQKAFAKGWRTHNEAWGADHYAHGTAPLYDGYVNQKAKILSDETGLDFDFMHFAVEVAIDWLVKTNDDPKIGAKLLEANLLRSWEDRNLLVNVFVWREKRTDWVTLASAELRFRNLVGRYAAALVLPSPLDKTALAKLGVQLAQEMYGITTVTEEQLLLLLESAIRLCESDYGEIIQEAIQGIK